MSDSIKNPLALFQILRPHHWVKNLVVFSPLVVVGNDRLLVEFVRGVEAFVVFSCAASLVYILNDVLDIRYDQQNPHKSDRPIVANQVSFYQVAAISVLLFALLILLLVFSGNRMITPIVIYILGNIVYSTIAKKIIFIDLVLLALFFHLRVYAGALIMLVGLSGTHYLFGFACFLGLAALKRYIEISHNPQGVPGRTYSLSHLRAVSFIGLFCATAATVLLIQYLFDPRIVSAHRHPLVLWLLVPLFVGEAAMLVHKAKRNQLSEDLTLLWRNDAATQVFVLVVLVTFALSRFS